jgi:hypothetical protein
MMNRKINFYLFFFLKREQIFLSNDKKKKKGFGFHVGMILEDLKR